jgi:hypothetical protein
MVKGSIALGLMLLFAGAPAYSAVQITVDKDNQVMTVDVDGATRYRWPVSSGLPAHETPSGTHKAFRMEEDHYSKEWDDAPMPHSIFFTKRGHAIHGTDSVNRLGNPASHGCVRLSRANAATLFALVKQEGVLSTTVTLTGSSQVALARGGTRRNPVATAVAVPSAEPQPQLYGAQTDYGAVARATAPQRRGQPQISQDDYVFDGQAWVYDARRAQARRRQEADAMSNQPTPQYANPYNQPRYYDSQGGRAAYPPQQRYYQRDYDYYGN